MKRLLLLLCIINVQLGVSAQIKTLDNKQINNVTKKIKYDSLTNYIDIEHIEQYIGQTLYLPKTDRFYEHDYDNFKSDIKGTKYYDNFDNSSSVDYPILTGKYFTVMDVVYNKEYYTPIPYLKLKENNSNNTLFFLIESKYSFPFIIEGYYKKMSQLFLNKDFYLEEKEAVLLEYCNTNRNIKFANSSILYGGIIKFKCTDHYFDETDAFPKKKQIFILSSEDGNQLHLKLSDMYYKHFISNEKLERLKNEWIYDSLKNERLISNIQEKENKKKEKLELIIKKYNKKKVYNIGNNMLDKLDSYSIDSIWYSSEYLDEYVEISLKDKMNHDFKITSNIINNEIILIESDFIAIPPNKKYPHVRYWKSIKNGEVKIGMTKTEARLSWGEPDDIRKTSGSWGVHEQWIYSSASSYLYFQNGKLSAIQN